MHDTMVFALQVLPRLQSAILRVHSWEEWVSVGFGDRRACMGHLQLSKR